MQVDNMPYDRGGWRYSGTGGFSNSNQDKKKFTYPKTTQNKKLITCPICGKEQPITRITCIGCTYDFKKRNEDFEILMAQFKKENIPLQKLQKIVKGNYYNQPKSIMQAKLVPKIFNHIFNTNNARILFVSNNDEVIKEVQEGLVEFECDKTVARLSDDFIDIDSLSESIHEFKSINNSLFKNYSITSFDNIDSAKNIPDLKYLVEEVHYIDEDDAERLNDFIKIYWKYWLASQEHDIDLKLESKNLDEEISCLKNNLSGLKKSIKWFADKVNWLTGIYDSFGISYGNIENQLDLIEDIQILNENPHLIDKNEELEFINDIKKYNVINNDKVIIHDEIYNLLENEHYVSRVINNFKNYINLKLTYEKINNEIINLKNHLKACGINCDNLHQYYDIKNRFVPVSNMIYFDKEEYYALNNNLDQYLSNHKTAFDLVIYRNKNVLSDYIFDLIKENEIYVEKIIFLKERVNEIYNILVNSGINLNSISDIKSSYPLKILLDLSNDFSYSNDFSDSIKLLKKFESEVSSDLTITQYSIMKMKSLKGLINEIFLKLNIDFNDSFDLEFIEYNLDTLRNMNKKMGINISSITQMNVLFNHISTLADLSDLNEFNLEKFNTQAIFTDATLNYLKNNNKSDILYDLNILNISIKSLIYEFNQNNDYEIYDNLNLNKNSLNDDFKNNVHNLKGYSSFIDSHDFKQIRNYYNEIFENCFELVKKGNLDQYFEKLNDLKFDFDFLNELYDQLDDEMLKDTQTQLSKLKENQLIYDNINKSYKKGLFSDKTLDLIKNNQIGDKIKRLFDLFDEINDLLIENSFNSLNCEDIIKLCNQLLNEYHKKEIEYPELLSKVNIIGNNNFEEKFSDLNFNLLNHDNSKIKEILNDFNLIYEILCLKSKLTIPMCDDIIKLNYSELKMFNQFLDSSRKFSDYVRQGIINKDLFSNFTEEITSIDDEINSLKQELYNLNLEESILNNFSKVKSEKLDDITARIDEIDEIMQMESDDIHNVFENQKLIVDNLNSLCNDYPNESEYLDNEFNASYFKENMFKLRMKFSEFENLLNLENNILKHDELINKNLIYIWDGLLTDINKIESKFLIDNKFTENYYKHIFSEKTIQELNSSNIDLTEINNFKNNLKDDKSNYILLHNNKEYLLNELSNLEKYDDSDLIGFKNSFENINKILNLDKITDTITLLRYHIGKNNENQDIEGYLKQLNNYSLLYYKYFDETEFNISMDEILNKINMNCIFTDLLDRGIVKESYLEQIKLNKKDFISCVDNLEEIKKDILNKFDKCSKVYSGNKFSKFFNPKTKFNKIKRIEKDLKHVEISLANMDYVKRKFIGNYQDYFDYVVCDRDELEVKEEFQLFLISRNKINFVQVRE